MRILSQDLIPNESEISNLTEALCLIRWPLVAEVSRKVLGWRLKAMPYLYTAFYDSHTFGCPIARPLWFNFPSDSTTLQLHEQWMMGELQRPCTVIGFSLFARHRFRCRQD